MLLSLEACTIQTNNLKIVISLLNELWNYLNLYYVVTCVILAL